jgi:HK97 family phage major capsid protein
VWGLPIVLSDAIAEGTALVGDYANFVELAERRGIEVQVSDSHSDFFIKGKQAIRADMRAALPIYRPQAFCEVTGI